MPTFRSLTVAAALTLAAMPVAQAQIADPGSKAEAERAVQNYLAMWSSNQAINDASVLRFYAPRVIYYGKSFSRAQVLADKTTYIHHWPVRDYKEVPGSFTAHCNVDRSLCKVSADMTWRRVSTSNAVSVGRARLTFDFVPIEGGRKIARESARIL
ncbi:hypothetical protein [Beijerinckia sp. L45]|uniref:hypothetical protein n=1 Tax=Beijerinckia sp. L45 TaxID=1641855 RepID=UPI00131AFD97|nr:hypothetical protein [Beijerinckia sp. L45]